MSSPWWRGSRDLTSHRGEVELWSTNSRKILYPVSEFMEKGECWKDDEHLRNIFWQYILLVVVKMLLSVPSAAFLLIFPHIWGLMAVWVGLTLFMSLRLTVGIWRYLLIFLQDSRLAVWISLDVTLWVGGLIAMPFRSCWVEIAFRNSNLLNAHWCALCKICRVGTAAGPWEFLRDNTEFDEPAAWRFFPGV